MLTTFIAGIQVDIQAAVVYDSITGIQTALNYLYIVRNNIEGDDQPDTFSNTQVHNPCSSNPCQNGGACAIGIKGDFVCFCPGGFTGIVFGYFDLFLHFIETTKFNIILYNYNIIKLFIYYYFHKCYS